MAPLSYVLIASGHLLELLLLWRVFRERLWRPYPFLSAYIVYVSCASWAFLFILQLSGYSSRPYAVVYWGNEIAAAFLWIFIVWEIFRHSFPSGLPIRRFVGAVSVLLAAAAGGLLFAHGAAGLPRTLGYVVPNAERYASLVAAPVILWLLVAAQYYRIPLGRNIWGVAIGFGMFLSSTAANFAAALLGSPLAKITLLLGPASFVGMLAIWVWALWRYAPNPECAPALAECSELDLILWRKEWHRLLTSMRKVFER
jgi:hypothetical protein